MNKDKNTFKPLAWLMTLLLAAVVAGCGDGGGSAAAPSLGAGGGTTGATCAGVGCVNLGTSANYVILAQTGVSTVPTSVVTGNVGLSPAARGFLTGWSLIAEPTDTAYRSAQVTGRLYAADMVGGTTSVDLTTAVGDMGTAYNTANGLAPLGGTVNGVLGVVCPGVGILNAITIGPGVYNCGNPVTITGNVTLDGAGVYVFQFAQTLTQSAGTQVNFANGAVAQNVFWVVAQGVDIGTTAAMKGVILGKTLINLQTGATANGRLLAQTAVTLDKATVTVP